MRTQQNTHSEKNGGTPAEPKAETALLLVDLVTDFKFEDGDALWEETSSIIQPVAELAAQARAAGLPVVYVNDIYGNWREDFERQVSRIMKSSERGRQVIRDIQPAGSDYYILKPQRSGFYETPLAVLLSSLEVSSLIIAGITTDICVLFTAHDAYMRGYSVSVPPDCTAAVSNSYKSEALKLMQRVADVEVRLSTELTISELIQK